MSSNLVSDPERGVVHRSDFGNLRLSKEECVFLSDHARGNMADYSG